MSRSILFTQNDELEDGVVCEAKLSSFIGDASLVTVGLLVLAILMRTGYDALMRAMDLK